MPHGCAVWPAFWLDGSNWPYNGEMDIVEGMNERVSYVVLSQFFCDAVWALNFWFQESDYLPYWATFGLSY